MKPTKKSKIIQIVIVCGLFLIASCGKMEEENPNYKAQSTITGNGSPTTITNTANSPAEMNIGDIYALTFDSEQTATIEFDGVDRDTGFILAVNSLNTGDVSNSIQVIEEGSNSLNESESMPLEWQGWSAHEALDQQLRNFETIQSNAKFDVSQNIGKAMLTTSNPKTYKIDDQESFKVLSGISSLSSYTTVRAKIKCIAQHVIFYIDEQVTANNPDDLTDDDVEKLCMDFDAAAGKEFQIFGETSDINRDGYVAVLMTPQVNRIGAMGGGIVTGFFFANDLYAGTNSNLREIIYVMVPDSNGIYGVSIPKFFAIKNLLPAVLPHELQHAINYNQKVLIAGGGTEENWLNEGLAHLAEDILGYGQENPSRVGIYLNNTALYGPVSSGSPNLAERGASFLFLRFLYEQAADSTKFIWNLLHSDLTGIVNLETAFDSSDLSFDQLSEFLLRWNTAIAMSSFNLSTDPRFSYHERIKNSETDHWEGVCLNCQSDDGRGTVLAGASVTPFAGMLQANLEPTASKFYQVLSRTTPINMRASYSGTYGATLIRYK